MDKYWFWAIILVILFFTAQNFILWQEQQINELPCEPGDGKAILYRENGKLICEIHEKLSYGSGEKNPYITYPVWLSLERRY